MANEITKAERNRLEMIRLQRIYKEHQWDFRKRENPEVMNMSNSDYQKMAHGYGYERLSNPRGKKRFHVQVKKPRQSSNFVVFFRN